jgi:hypothetical protein
MKIIFEPKMYKIVKIAILLIAVAMAGYVVYASSTLSFSNTAVITSGANILISQPTTTSFTLCAGQSYTAAPTGVSWSIPAGGSQIQYFCIQNTGTGPTAGTFTFTLGSATGLSGTTTYAPVSANSATTSPIAYTVSATAGATPGTFTIQVN